MCFHHSFDFPDMILEGGQLTPLTPPWRQRQQSETAEQCEERLLIKKKTQRAKCMFAKDHWILQRRRETRTAEAETRTAKVYRNSAGYQLLQYIFICRFCKCSSSNDQISCTLVKNIYYSYACPAV